MLIDTHTHIYSETFDGENPDALSRALTAGVGKMILPNVDLDSVKPVLDLSGRYPDVASVAFGLHPTEVREDWREVYSRIEAFFFSAPRVVAVGEVGVDLYWDKTFADPQMQAFEHQLYVARQLGLPVIIHCREALEQTLEVIKPFPDVKAVFHSFGGTVADVDRIRRVGDYYFGINGVVTFKNSRLRDSLPAIGLDRILLETDAPYLAPVPYRGKRNESAYLPLIASHIAGSMDLAFDQVASSTTANALRMFAL